MEPPQIEAAVMQATGLAQDRKEPYQAYLERLTRAADKLSDEEWGILPTPVQEWVQDAIDCLSYKTEIPGFGEAPPNWIKELQKEERMRSYDDDEDQITVEDALRATEYLEELKTEMEELGYEDELKEKTSPKSKSAAKTKKSTTIIRGVVVKTRREKIPDEAIIRLLREGNPKREGTAAHIKYSFFKDGMTVGEYRALADRHKEFGSGWPNGEINWCRKQGFIKIEMPSTQDAKEDREDDMIKDTDNGF